MSQPRPYSTGELTQIRWSEVCPWLILVRALRVSLMVRVLLLAFVGTLLTEWGWSTIDHFSAEPASLIRLTDGGSVATLLIDAQQRQHLDPSFAAQLDSPFPKGWLWVSAPLIRLVDRNLSALGSLTLLLSGLWAIIVWSFFGSAITRIAALQLTRGEPVGPLKMLRDTATVMPSTIGAPLMVLLVGVTMGVPLTLLGLLLQSHFVALIAGPLWVIVLAWGFLLAVVLLGLLFGWPLMWACLGVEQSDAFDGASRCYAYVYQKPLQLAFYLVVAALLSWLGAMIVMTFAAATSTLSEWGLSWGTGSLRAADLFDTHFYNSPTPPTARMIQGWKACFASLTAAFPMACLWPMSVGIYLLLRQHVDATELDEVALSRQC